MVYDTDVYYELSTDEKLLAPVSVTTGPNPASVWEAGVAADFVHLDDLARVDLGRYRVVIFDNTFRLTGEQRAVIRDRVLTQGRHIIWFYAPGYSDGQTRSVQNVESVTGIRLAEMPPGTPAAVAIHGGDLDHDYDLGPGPVQPLFRIADPRAKPVGVYRGTDAAAVARVQTPDGTSWFVAVPDPTPALLRYLLRQTPAHVFGSDHEVFYAGGGMVVMHTAKAGPHEVSLRNGRAVECQVPEGGATVILDAETGQPL